MATYLNRSDLMQCNDMIAVKNDYVTSTCPDSITKVCTSAYTDNPPFSCSKDTYPTFITTIATAFANASGVWTFVVIFLKIMLKISYPHGFYDYDYDEERERFVPKGFKPVYPDVFSSSKRTGVEAQVYPNDSSHDGYDNPRKQVEDDGLRQRNNNTESGNV